MLRFSENLIWGREDSTQVKSEGIWLKRKKREWVGVIQEERRAHGKSKSAQQPNQVALIRYYFKWKWKLGVVFVKYERVFGVSKQRPSRIKQTQPVIWFCLCFLLTVCSITEVACHTTLHYIVSFNYFLVMVMRWIRT
jgi:hypothetical protein